MKILAPVVLLIGALLTGNAAAAIPDAVALIRAEAGAHRLLLVGEMHGTRETPQLVAALAESYAATGPVLLALELDGSLMPAIKSYLASEGGPQAHAKLLAASAWHVPRTRNDGRRNLEVIELIERMRVLRKAGRDVAVLPFDFRLADSTDSQARDRAMAARLRIAHESLPRGRLIVLAGNVHAWLAKPSFGPPELQDPMGSWLVDLEPWSVYIAARGGEYWACRERCGPSMQAAVFHSSGRVTDGTSQFRIVLPRYTVARLIEE